ncbi:MAG: 4-hydroxythreonine-4-phosphate dehydrogenase PdxA, partial [Desulfobulbaceae bacterium]|nr:4-hydroxythreonine-4-phosphate dehydrogenase PdxA [Desulfobulbaceae bacterium]
GDFGVVKHVAVELGYESTLIPWQPGDPVQSGTLPIYSVSDVPVQELTWGRPNLKTSRAMVACIEQAVQLIEQKKLAGMCTCPISKISLKQIGSPYPGHTEMLAALTGIKKRFRMMMAGGRLKVGLVTIHESIARVSGLLSKEEILDCIEMTVKTLQGDFGLASPKIGVAGLNPHSGESGMFGHEEEDLIAPAVAEYAGPATVSGPWPPDTVFYRAVSGDFDAVVAMYHDQGLIPFKLIHFHDGVNVTLGLPIVRTSVDHGTAYDIAGRGLAQSSSLEAAVNMAFEIIANRTRGSLS